MSEDAGIVDHHHLATPRQQRRRVAKVHKDAATGRAGQIDLLPEMAMPLAHGLLPQPPGRAGALGRRLTIENGRQQRCLRPLVRGHERVDGADDFRRKTLHAGDGLRHKSTVDENLSRHHANRPFRVSRSPSKDEAGSTEPLIPTAFSGCATACRL